MYHQDNKNTKTLPNKQIQIQLEVFLNLTRVFLIRFTNVRDRDTYTHRVSKNKVEKVKQIGRNDRMLVTVNSGDYIANIRSKHTAQPV